MELSTAVKSLDIGSKTIKGYRATLIDLINNQESLGTLSSTDAANYRARVAIAPVESFRAEVWRLDLRSISKRKYGYEDVPKLKVELEQLAQNAIKPPQVLQPGEYLIHDLRSTEYEVIIVG